ncbi:unnamed protein product, partial [Mesorhabditis belari]|uniref:Uncharacterized protein n=1 Tax=Mesorhabditis belari TaxID=2138241 RepID=A0AAF3J8Z1_9BILA
MTNQTSPVLDSAFGRKRKEGKVTLVNDVDDKPNIFRRANPNQGPGNKELLERYRARKWRAGGSRSLLHANCSKSRVKSLNKSKDQQSNNSPDKKSKSRAMEKSKERQVALRRARRRSREKLSKPKKGHVLSLEKEKHSRAELLQTTKRRHPREPAKGIVEHRRKDDGSHDRYLREDKENYNKRQQSQMSGNRSGQKSNASPNNNPDKRDRYKFKPKMTAAGSGRTPTTTSSHAKKRPYLHPEYMQQTAPKLTHNSPPKAEKQSSPEAVTPIFEPPDTQHKHKRVGEKELNLKKKKKLFIEPGTPINSPHSRSKCKPPRAKMLEISPDPKEKKKHRKRVNYVESVTDALAKKTADQSPQSSKKKPIKGRYCMGPTQSSRLISSSRHRPKEKDGKQKRVLEEIKESIRHAKKSEKDPVNEVFVRFINSSLMQEHVKKPSAGKILEPKKVKPRVGSANEEVTATPQVVARGSKENQSTKLREIHEYWRQFYPLDETQSVSAPRARQDDSREQLKTGSTQKKRYISPPPPLPRPEEKLRVNVDELLNLGRNLEKHGVRPDKKKAFGWLALNRDKDKEQGREFAENVAMAIGDLVISEQMYKDVLEELINYSILEPEEAAQLFATLSILEDVTIGRFACLLRSAAASYAK